MLYKKGLKSRVKIYLKRYEIKTLQKISDRVAMIYAGAKVTCHDAYSNPSCKIKYSSADDDECRWLLTAPPIAEGAFWHPRAAPTFR